MDFRLSFFHVLFTFATGSDTPACCRCAMRRQLYRPYISLRKNMIKQITMGIYERSSTAAAIHSAIRTNERYTGTGTLIYNFIVGERIE